MSSKLTLQKFLSITTSNEEEDEETTMVAGREVTITQEPFIQADVRAARVVLERLQQKGVETTSGYCSSTVIKVIES